MIPRKQWIWDGHPGHLAVSHDCEFYLNTRIGDHRISTIGDWFPRDHPRGGMGEEIGLDRTHETFVFRVTGDGPGEVGDYLEIDSEVYNDCEAARLGHMAMCEKYARIGEGDTQ